ncbi:DNA polymerase III subunit gamma/tau [Desulfovibrio sp. OttesenSCG-928-F07]|nr:DNA polymerase III subunit gamma/tau [Desulfovibrio sp. OttesenSCG-928-F07]
MSNASLTARYRPQTFADVAGQATLKAILSRAASEDKIAPAYLFSGTRGVGKTTIARIFAKALNCRKAPAAEPCNECDNCRAITMGSSIDVVEIDGASNRGIDDVRRLKESVGYAPMDGRYKIFIIDEAHMLSREAFNALLKTLEEPPARVTFIMATTEPHKFPVTIISRCQHYVFKRLSDAELEAHLKKVLNLEGKNFEEGALRLIVRRAAGSVRDSMSLLGQVLALGSESLSEADTRMVLGLAGQELFFNLLAAVKHANCTDISVLVREMLDQGLDLGFFLRELSSMWRNLFMLRQAGEEARAVVDLPETEVARWLEEAKSFDLRHIHACWQMTLEGQRRVLTSLEPALALELLLLNLALMPRLLSADQVSMLSKRYSSDLAEKKSPLTSAEAQAQSNTAHITGTETVNMLPAQGTATQPQPAQNTKVFEKPVLNNTEQTNSKTALTPAEQQQQNSVAEQELEGFIENTPPVSSGVADIAEPYAKYPESAPPPVEDTTPVELKPATATPANSAANTTAHTPDNTNNSPLANSVATASTATAIANTPAHTAGTSAQAVNTTANTVGTPAHAADTSPYSSGTATPATGTLTRSATELAQAAPENSDEHWYPEINNPALLGENTGPAGRIGDWEGFLAFCAQNEVIVPAIRKVEAHWQGAQLILSPGSHFVEERLKNPAHLQQLRKILADFCGADISITVNPPPEVSIDREALLQELEESPAIKALKEQMGAEIVDYGAWGR